MPRLSALAANLTSETAFTVLAMARALKAKGKDVVELEIGDSPFPSTPHAKAAGIKAIEENQTGYGPSLGLPEFREAAAKFVNEEFGFHAGPEHIVAATGAKPFETYFAEALLDPGDGVLVFSPAFPTYLPNLQRRGARAVMVPLLPENEFRPKAEDVEKFLKTDKKPRAIFLNSPHNPTGGVATRADLAAIADVVRGTDLMVFSDEPYCHMVWRGKHESILAERGMLDYTLAAYTFSKSYSMSGWRMGFAVGHPSVIDVIGKLINTSVSCSPPFVQRGAIAALEHDAATRDDYMGRFRRKVEPPHGGPRDDRRDHRQLRPPAPSTSSPTSARSATGWGSPRTAWPSICSRGPTTSSASPASAASASATPVAGSSGSVAPSPMNASTRRSRSCPMRPARGAETRRVVPRTQPRVRTRPTLRDLTFRRWPMRLTPSPSTRPLGRRRAAPPARRSGAGRPDRTGRPVPDPAAEGSVRHARARDHRPADFDEGRRLDRRPPARPGRRSPHAARDSRRSRGRLAKRRALGGEGTLCVEPGRGGEHGDGPAPEVPPLERRGGRRQR